MFIVGDAGATVKVVSTGGAITVTLEVAVLVTPPAVADAVIVADPAATPVTTPVEATTDATPDALELHVTVAAIALPF